MMIVEVEHVKEVLFNRNSLHVRSMDSSKLGKFQDDIISIDGVMTSRIVGIALKLCRLYDLVVAIICTNFCEFS